MAVDDVALKVQFIQKLTFCLHVLTLMSFQDFSVLETLSNKHLHKSPYDFGALERSDLVRVSEIFGFEQRKSYIGMTLG